MHIFEATALHALSTEQTPTPSTSTYHSFNRHGRDSLLGLNNCCHLLDCLWDLVVLELIAAIAAIDNCDEKHWDLSGPA